MAATLRGLTADLTRLYGQAELDVYRTTAAATRKGLDTTGWSVDAVYLRDDLDRLVLEASKRGADEAEDAVRRAYREGKARAAAEVAGEVTDTVGEQLEASIVRARSAVGIRPDAVTSQAMRAHLGALAQVQDLPGATKAERLAIAQARMDRMVDDGLSVFTDASGRRWGLRGYAEMAARAEAGNAERLGHQDELQAHGIRLVRISAHSGSCPRCAPYQGRVFSLTSTRVGQFRPIEEARAGGLFHPNCRHRQVAYLPFRSPAGRRSAHRPEAEAAQQRQRALERGVRYWRQREAAGLTPGAVKDARRVRLAWQRRLGEHVKAHDLRRLRYREF